MPSLVGGNTEQFVSKPKKGKGFSKPNAEPLPSPNYLPRRSPRPAANVCFFR
jgi:hypothetical protein